VVSIKTTGGGEFKSMDPATFDIEQYLPADFDSSSPTATVEKPKE
jgi:hypothetical protein